MLGHVTIRVALSVQEKHLKDWKSKLKKPVYKELTKFCDEQNEAAISSEDILRGNNLTWFIEQLEV